MAWPIVTVASGGLPVTEAGAFGAPVEEAANGYGTPVTFVASGGLPVSLGVQPGFGFLLTNTGDFLTDASGNRIIVESLVGNVSINTYLASLSALNIVALGDSHWNGPTPTVTAIDTSIFGTDGQASPLDRMWDVSGGDASYVKANSILVNPTGTSDSNLGLSGNVGSDLITLPRLLRLAYPMRCNIIRTANFGIGGASSYSWAGEQANLFTVAVTNATAGDTMVIGGVTYTYRAAVVSANDVLIGATANDSNRNLGRAVNAEGGTAGVDYGTGTVVNPLVYCGSATSAQYVKFSYRATGTAGNSSTVTSSTTARIAVASTVDLTPQLSQTMTGGAAVSVLYTSMKNNLALSGGMTPTVFVVCLGTNDALRTGWRSSGYQTEMQKLFDRLHTDYPLAKVIIWKAPPSSSGTTVTTIQLAAVDALVAANPTFVSSIDMNTPGAGTSDVVIRRPDGIHLTTYGGAGIKCSLFAKEIARVLGW